MFFISCWTFLSWKKIWPFLWMGFSCLKATEPLWGKFTFWHLLTRSLWYSTDRPPNDKTLSWPCGQPVVLNPGPRNWEPSALTTTPFFSLWVKSYYSFFKKSMMVLLSGFPLLSIANDQRQKCWELRENKIFLSFYNLVTILAKQFNIFC